MRRIPTHRDGLKGSDCGGGDHCGCGRVVQLVRLANSLPIRPDRRAVVEIDEQAESPPTQFRRIWRREEIGEDRSSMKSRLMVASSDAPPLCRFDASQGWPRNTPASATSNVTCESPVELAPKPFGHLTSERRVANTTR